MEVANHIIVDRHHGLKPRLVQSRGPYSCKSCSTEGVAQGDSCLHVRCNGSQRETSSSASVFYVQLGSVFQKESTAEEGVEAGFVSG